MKSNNLYYCFNEKGETTFPLKKELDKYKEQELAPILLLDSCICLELVKFADHKKKANIERDKLLNYLDYIHKIDIEVVSFLGLLELCHNPKTMQFNVEKFWDFKNRIDFLEELPLKFIKNSEFDYLRDYKILHIPELENNSLETFKPLILSTYCCLLKIRELAMNGLDKAKAIGNIENFLDWLINDLGRIMGIELQLAMNIFGGGVSDFRRMAWIDGKEEETQKKIWGTAWDIFHARISCNNISLSKHFGKNVSATFVTKDYILFKLISQLSLTAIIDNSPNGVVTSILLSSNSLPNFDYIYLNKMNKRMLALTSDRFNIEKNYDKERLIKLIEELEEKNKIK